MVLANLRSRMTRQVLWLLCLFLTAGGAGCQTVRGWFSKGAAGEEAPTSCLSS
jgi:hypothetical protein